MTTSERSVRVAIIGRVQGVGFRAFVEAEALKRELRGWVRNRRDGSVEAVFAGPEGVVDDVLAACRRGPRSARVEQMNVEPAAEAILENQRAGETFAVLPTA